MGNQPDLSRLSINKTEPPRRRAPGWIAIVAIVIVLGLLTFALSGGDEQAALPPVTAAAATEAPPPNAAGVAAAVLNATGYVVAQRKAAVSSKATGRLEALHVVEGDVVKKDQLLGELESKDLKAAVAEAAAQIEVAQAQIVAAQAELQEASLQRTRIVTLEKQNSASKAERDQAEARFLRSEAALVSARANLTLAAARRDRSQVELDYTRILAPFDGTVLTKNADVGEIVAPFGSSANARAAIVTLADMSSLEVEADVSEANLGKVSVGQSVTITLDSRPGRTYKGEVTKIVPTVDRAKATVLTKIRFLERDDGVIPEMSAKVAFQLRE